MPAVVIEPEDLEPFASIEEAKATEMIADALAVAELVAPCIATDEFTKTAAAKAILRGAILRWHESGSGAISSQTVGPFGQTLDTRQARKAMFWPSEIEQLQSLCRSAPDAFAVDTVAAGPGPHAAACALNLGALYCSCGASLTGSYPLWEA